MKKSAILLTGTLIVLLSGCASQRPLWEADNIANSSSTILNLTDQKGKIYATVNTNTVRLAITAKNKVEEAAGQVRTKFWIDAEKKPNAYAWYNNNQASITVNIGMLQILGEDEDAHAALYGHELAHLYLGHNAKYAQRHNAKQAGAMVLGLALGLAGIPGGGTIADVTTTAIATVYSREDEREADAQGVKYILQAGYDPYGAVRLHEKIKAAGGDALIPFLSTHPSGDERIKDMKKLAGGTSASKTVSIDTKPIEDEDRNSSKPVAAIAEVAHAPVSIPAMVRIPGKNYEIGKYEVTQAEWRTVMGSNPSRSANCGGTCPVEQVSWNDIQEFLRRLNTKTSKQYRLPTEEEWEYACYGGSQTEYCGGNNINAVAWSSANSIIAKDNNWGYPHPVGRKQANGYGLYDMSGNVWEWTNDCWQGHCFNRALRGGSWYSRPTEARALERSMGPTERRSNESGFRLARTLDAPLPEPVVATPPTAHVAATPSSNTLPVHDEGAADRIRLLNLLYKEGVISQTDFETKKQEILKSM